MKLRKIQKVWLLYSIFSSSEKEKNTESIITLLDIQFLCRCTKGGVPSPSPPMSPISMPTSTLLYPVFPGWLQYAADTAATKCVCLNRWSTEALKGHRVFWKIAICYLVRVIQEWKRMSSGWHNNMFVTHPEEISTPAKSSGWHMMVWYVIRTTYCSVHKSSEWKTVNS